MYKPLHRSHARQLGVCYLLYFTFAIWGGLLLRGFVVHGDAAASAQNFARHEVALRASSGLELASVALYLALTTLFYELFRPVSRTLSLAATLLSVTGCSIQALSDVFLVPFQTLASSRVGVGTGESTLVKQTLLEIHAQAISDSLILFGGFDLVIGILILRSCLFPQIFGVLIALAGVGWLVHLWPPIAARLSHVVQTLGFLSEAVFMIWLLARGVDEERWRALAGPDTMQS